MSIINITWILAAALSRTAYCTPRFRAASLSNFRLVALSALCCERGVDLEMFVIPAPFHCLRVTKAEIA
jgi:hypothetical protein